MATIIIIIAFIFAIGVIAVCLINRAERRYEEVLRIKEIDRCESIGDIVMAVNHGRVYPYFTGMGIEQVKKTVRQYHSDTTEFDNILHLQELMGNIRGVKTPLSSNALVNEVYLHLNKDKIVSSITMDISSLDFVSLVEQMLLKFGEPASLNSQIMVWRDSYMTISLDSVNKFLNIMDERLPNISL